VVVLPLAAERLVEPGWRRAEISYPQQFAGKTKDPPSQTEGGAPGLKPDEMEVRVPRA
jgi:hypothetical protein